jgi:hypothetical protein
LQASEGFVQPSGVFVFYPSGLFKTLFLLEHIRKGGNYAQANLDGSLFVRDLIFLGNLRSRCSTGRKVDRHRGYDRNEDRSSEESTCTGHFR